MISDNRSHPRVGIFSGGELYRRPDGERIGRALIKDVSATGLRVETLETLVPGEQVFLDFQVAGGPVFNRVATRVERVQSHAGSFLAGLSFQREDVRHRIRQVLAKLFEVPGD
jgi:hypothetical protein